MLFTPWECCEQLSLQSGCLFLSCQITSNLQIYMIKNSISAKCDQMYQKYMCAHMLIFDAPDQIYQQCHLLISCQFFNVAITGHWYLC